MKIVALMGSPRKRGNTNRILDEVIRGAEENGNEVVKYYLDQLNISPCSACAICANGNDCRFSDDDGGEIIDLLADGASMILATPIYFGQMTAQSKIIVDRLYSILTNPDKSFSGKAALIVTHSYPKGGNDDYIKLTENQPFIKNTDYEFLGTLEVPELIGLKDVEEKPEYLKEAYELGKKF